MRTALDLLENLLKFDPADRLSASEALLHPYFTSVASPAAFNTTPGAMGPPSYNFPHPHGHQAQQHIQQQQQQQQMQYGRQTMMYSMPQQVPIQHPMQAPRVHPTGMNPTTMNPQTYPGGNVPYPAPYPTR